MLHCLPILWGVEGHRLSQQEKDFFTQYPALGFILFTRNVQSKAQLLTLVKELKEFSVFPLVLIDEEGGAVSRLKSLDPSYATPPVASFLQEEDGLEKLRLHYEFIGQALQFYGITVNCAPVLDLLGPDTAPFLQSRCLGSDATQVAKWGKVAIDTLSKYCIPVIKHMPGHGAVSADSHYHLPTASLDWDEWQSHLFPFQENKKGVWGMSSHMYLNLFQEVVTFSPKTIEEMIRRRIGFEGFLISDDLYMNALQPYSIPERVSLALKAGHDAVLVCHPSQEVRMQCAQLERILSEESVKRLLPSLDALVR